MRTPQCVSRNEARRIAKLPELLQLKGVKR
jgi:hypothetical protein